MKRTNPSFINGTEYSFGNQFTTVTFLGIGTKPTWLSCTIAIGTAPTWKSDAINRVYSFAQNGTGTDQVITNLHFLTTELQSNAGANLVFWDHSSGGTAEEHGKTNYITNISVGLSGLTLEYLAPTLTKEWTLSNSVATKNTWLGADGTNPTKWDVTANWSGGIPASSADVLIPGSLTYYPVLTLAVEVKSLEIALNATFTTGSNTLTINGYTGAFTNNGTFTGTGGTVVFSNGTITNIATMGGTGTNTFNNLTVNANTYLQPASGFYLKIAGAVSLGTGSIIDLKATTNTVEYNGSGQNIINLQGPSSNVGYSNLVNNSSGTTTLPATLNVMHDFTLTAGTAAATAASTIAILGNVTLTSGTFTGSSAAIGVGGNWTNNGATFTPGTSMVTFISTTASQAIQGTATSQTFNNITINKTGQTLILGSSTTTLAVKDITITAGTFDSGTTTTINLSGNWSNAGSFTADGGTVAFTGSVAQTISGTAATAFHNLTINNTAAVGEGNSRVSITNDLITVNWVLYLQSSNASSTQGTLHTGTYILNMGQNATTTGTGDVTGFVKRTHTFSNSVDYSFGSAYTTINFVSGSSKPTSLTCNIAIGTVAPWSDGSWTGGLPLGKVKRVYGFAQTGSGTDLLTLNLRYLTSELDATDNDESKLVMWHKSSVATYTTPHEHGKSNQNFTNHWIGFGSIVANLLAPTTSTDNSVWTMAYSLSTKNTWTHGGGTTAWNLGTNWSKGHYPGQTGYTDDDVLIPGEFDVAHYPVLSADVQFKSIEINGIGALGGIPSVTADSYTITVTGTTGAWINNGSFVPGTGTVLFMSGTTSAASTIAGTTDFNNLQVGAITELEPALNSILNISGSFTADGSSLLDFVAQNNTVNYTGTGSRTIINPAGEDGALGYYNLTFSNTVGTITIPAALTISGDFTNNGIIDALTNSSTLTMIHGMDMDGHTIGGTGSTVFNNLTINNIVGVTGTADFTINGILDLQSADINPDPFTYDTPQKGALDMAATKKLSMGSSATTTGTGDVTGIVRRAHTFVAGTTYTFNHQFTTMILSAGGTLPTAMENKLKIGTAPSWKPSAVKRIDDWIREGGATGCYLTIASHYLDSELQGNDENKIVRWKYVSTASPTVAEVGRSAYSTSDNWVANSNIDVVTKINTAYGWERSYANSEAATLTWNGSSNTDFSNQNNWTPSGTPGLSSNIVIPDASLTNNDPTLSADITINSLSIENAGVLNSGIYTLTINGTTGAWNNQGTFDAGTGTVVFTGNGADLGGTNDFNNLTIAASARLATQAGAVIGIGGAVTINGAAGTRGIWSTVSSGETTVNYNGGSQTVVIPDASTRRYYNLILSGSGAKTMPVSALTLLKNLTISGTAAVTGGAAVAVAGMLTIETGSSFSTGAFTHSVGGDIFCDGTLTSSGGTVVCNGSAAQFIKGTGTATFNNLTIDNSVKVTLTNSATTTVAGTLLINSGRLIEVAAGKCLTVSGTLTNSAGITGLVILSDASGTGSLINSTAEVSATVQRYMNNADWTNWKDGWHFLSSPVASQAISPNFTTDPYDFYCWYEPSNLWVNYKNTGTEPTWNTANGSTNFTVGKGYMAAYEVEGPKSFSGTLNVADVPVTGLTITGLTQVNRSWHLLGNPFASALTWDATDVWGLTNIAGTAKIWNEAIQSYSDLTSLPSSSVIPATNGFMVQVSTGTGSLTIPASKRVHSAQGFYKSAVPCVKLVARNTAYGNAQESNIFFQPEATSGFDLMYDGEFLAGYAPLFYSVAGDVNLSTNALPEAGGTVQIPFNFIKNEGTAFTIEAKTISGIYGEVLLNDLKTGTAQDLTQNPVYTFTSASGDNASRFLVTFSHVGIGEAVAKNSITIYSSGNSIYVTDKTGQNQGVVLVYNLMGQLLKQQALTGNGVSQISLSVTTGYYLVKVVTPQQTRSAKIFIQ